MPWHTDSLMSQRLEFIEAIIESEADYVRDRAEKFRADQRDDETES